MNADLSKPCAFSSQLLNLRLCNLELNKTSPRMQTHLEGSQSKSCAKSAHIGGYDH